MNKKPIPLISLIVFLPLISIDLAGAKKIQRSQKDYSVSVNLKLIQVFVTDKDGSPIQDLEKSDFVLYDNGKRMEITDFERHVLEKKERKTAEKKPPEISNRMNRKFLILLDILGNDEVGVLQSKEMALHFVETQLMPSDEVGIISSAPLTGLNLNTYFTTDHDKIKAAIKNAKEVSETKWEGRTLEQLKAQSEADAEQKHSTSSQGVQGKSSGLDIGGESQTTSTFVRPFRDPGLSHIRKNSVQILIDVTELSKILRYIPGIKHILFFSGGGHQKLNKFYERLGMELAGANCLVHTINAMGTRSNFLGWSRPSQETLQNLASASGGKYYNDVRNYETIAEDIQNLSGNYYVLGYYVDEKWDGSYHKIQVTVKKEECLVYSQGGYFNPKPFSQFSEFEKKLHLIDLALSDKPYFQDPIDIPLETLLCSNSIPSNCVLLAELPVNYFGRNPGEKIELINIICDEEKKIIDSSRGEVDYKELQDIGNFQYAILSLPPGRYECRVAMRNLKTGQGAFGLSSVTIPEDQEPGLVLFSPLILIPDKKSRYLKLSPENEQAKDISLNQIYPFISNSHSPLIHQLPRQTTRIFAVLRYAPIDIQQPGTELNGTLINESTGDRIFLSFNVLASKKLGDTNVLLTEINLPDLKPGNYVLTVCLAKSESNARSQAVRSFMIR